MTVLESLYRYLSGVLSVPVYTEIPESMPKRFVTLEKTSGGEENFIYNSTIAVQSWAESLADADTLNDVVKSAMRDAVTIDMICRCKLNSDYNFTDTTSKKYRYQAVFDVVHY